jgi:hypothetical protein
LSSPGRSNCRRTPVIPWVRDDGFYAVAMRKPMPYQDACHLFGFDIPEGKPSVPKRIKRDVARGLTNTRRTRPHPGDALCGILRGHSPSCHPRIPRPEPTSPFLNSVHKSSDVRPHQYLCRFEAGPGKLHRAGEISSLAECEPSYIVPRDRLLARRGKRLHSTRSICPAAP